MSSSAFRVVIPARYGSTRLPGKPLLAIQKRPMILHVMEQAQSSGALSVTVATDDQRIVDVVEQAGGSAELTAADHPSGTDRIAEVCQMKGWQDDDIIVNVQGDEPRIPPALIRQVADGLAEHRQAAVSTLCAALDSAGQLVDPNVVKVVRDNKDFALYFSRAPIPWNRDEFAGGIPDEVSDLSGYRRHIGIYAYRRGFLRDLVSGSPCDLERTESLEQLRVLHLGARIHCADACVEPGHGVDTMDDLNLVNEMNT